MASSTSADPPISTLGIYVDLTMSVKGNTHARLLMREVEGTSSGEVARDELGAVSELACNALRARAVSAAYLAASAV